MKGQIFVCFLSFFITIQAEISVLPPKLQRKSIGEKCTLQWTLSGPISSYTIVSLSSVSPLHLPSNSNHSYDSSTGIIKLFIWNIQAQDAGLYLLTVNNGSSEQNSNGVLFVFSQPWAYLVQALGRNPANEGDTIELNCSASISSSPEAYRPTKLYYFWRHVYYGELRNVSNGPAILKNGDPLPGYSFKNDGKTFVITSVKGTDYNFQCGVQEEGSPYKSQNYNYLQLTVNCPPYADGFNPSSKKLNIIFSGNVYLAFSLYGISRVTFCSNWTLLSRTGNNIDLGQGYNDTYNRIFFNSFFNSEQYYGNYSVACGNMTFTRTVTFQVLPPATPDPPANFTIQYITQSLISFAWSCMWYNGYQQTVFVLLKKSSGGKEIELSPTILNDLNCYNTKYSTLFQTNIEPDTEYDASIWSNNTLGSSVVQTLTVRTQKRPTFSASCENISLTDSQAVISVTTSLFNVTWLNVTCCLEETALCSKQSYTLLTPVNQIVFDDLPSGNEYIFDFILFNSDFYVYWYSLALAKGVRISRISGCDKTDREIRNSSCVNQYAVDKNNSLYIAVIVLAVLLGISVLALIGCLIAYLVWKKRSQRQQSLYLPKPSTMASRPTTWESQMDANPYENYEEFQAAESGYEGKYIELNQPPPKPPKVQANRYE